MPMGAGRHYIMEHKIEVYIGWIEACRLEGRGLTKWEEGFLDSLEEQITRTSSLSERQAEILERIYAEKTP